MVYVWQVQAMHTLLSRDAAGQAHGLLRGSWEQLHMHHSLLCNLSGIQTQPSGIPHFLHPCRLNCARFTEAHTIATVLACMHVHTDVHIRDNKLRTHIQATYDRPAGEGR